MHKVPKLGPIGKGWVREIKTKEGTRFVARWNAFIIDETGERKRVICGPHELGLKVKHGPGFHNIKQAKDAWNKIYWSVFQQHHPTAATKPNLNGVNATAEMKVPDFIKLVYEPRRVPGMEENSKINWDYYRDSFLIPFFGEYTLASMNTEDAVKSFMSEIGQREFSDWTAKKAFTYVKAILDMSRDLGITTGNASRVIPKNRRIPKGVKKAHSQPAITSEQFIALLNEIEKPRDRIILRLLFFCALRRSELFVGKWGDFKCVKGMHTLTMCRSFCSRTHKIKEWNPAIKAHGKVAIPPQLAEEIIGWGKYGDTNASDPNSFIFPVRTGKCIIPTNWHEDVLKPAAERAGVPGVTYYWFRRGYATEQHHSNVADKPIQGQLRHKKVSTTQNIYIQHIDKKTWDAVVELEKSVGRLQQEAKDDTAA